ncbi:PDZ domain-containing protein [Acinetobacter baumannii]|nr:PDZ domain-containing protein [Acinetobacter baumannii]
MKKKILTFSLLMASSFSTYADSYMYQYENKDGSTVITNKKSSDPNLTLIKVIKVKSSGDDDLSVGEDVSKISDKNLRRIIVTSDGRFIDVPISSNNLSSSSKEKAKTVTNVSKFYKPAALREEVKKSLKYLKPGEQVQVLEVSPGLESYKSYSAQGYAAIGQSIFRDWDVSKDSLINQAKKVGATFVTFSKYTESIVSYTKSDDPNNLGFIYNYEVLFYVKDESFKNPNTFGIQINSIPLEKRRTYQRNTGVYVLNVVEGSRAYNANVLLEDVIIAINGNPILTADDFDNIKAKELKKTKVLNLKILRLVNNELKELNIPVNF